MEFNSGGIGEDPLTYQNVKNLSLKENSIRNLKKIGKENSESAAISVARIGASVEKKIAARSYPYARKTKTRIKNLSPKRNGIHNLDLNRIGKENSESAAISVARINANAEKKLLQGSRNPAMRLNNKIEEISDKRDQLERELEGSSNAAIELINKVEKLKKKSDKVKELNEKVFSIEAERNTLKDQITKIQNELARKESEIGRFNDQVSKSNQQIEQLKQQFKEKEEPKSVRNLEQLQNISGRNKIETTVPENSAESELNSTRLTEFEGNNTHVQASATPAETVTSTNVKNIVKVPVMLETPSDKSGSQKLVSVQQEMSSVANESSGQVNSSQTNGMQPNNSSNGSILVTQSVQKNKWPTTATWKLAIAGVLAGIAASVAYFTFSASLLVTGVISGVGACCLVAAAIVCYCNKLSSSLEKISIDKVAVNGYTAAASCE
ncbi:MAG: hypothetical protein O7167_02990 [Wolbachia endosymbiont of Andrena nigroaenea]|nr:hypothetical protein [Wolbachia endosymbiont of Andrena nigroaenea]